MTQKPGSVFDVRMRGFRDRADVDDMIDLIDARVQARPAEVVSIHEAAGRSLATVVRAPLPVPGFDRAAMDGYAVRGEETFGASPYNELDFEIIGESLPARPCSRELGPGQAVRIMTGAPLPAGADAVLMAESAREESGRVFAAEAVPPGKNVGHVGEDIAAGATLLTPPRVLRPQDVAICAACGIDALPVGARPLVSIIVTGDELLPPGSKPHGCQIVDSNSIMLDALVRRDGGRPEVLPIVPDNRHAVRTALETAAGDCLLVSGGSSVGKEDHAPMLLAELGELAIHGLALRPASPAGMGFLGDKVVFLLPGNPVSCLCAYDLFVNRAIHRMAGREPGWPYPARMLPLGRKITSAVGRVDYVRVRITADQAVEPLAVSGASILSSTTRADGFVLVPKDLEGYPEGASVLVHLYDPSLPVPRNLSRKAL